ncbi:hypothetical protein [Turicibacter bilis]
MVLSFIPYPQRKISRYSELPSLNTATKHQAPHPNHTQGWWHWELNV